MKVTEQIQEVSEGICTDYCKYPALYHERVLRDEFNNDDEAMESMMHEVCNNCPLMRL